MLTTCILGSIDLLTEPFCITGWELPANQRTKAYEEHLTAGGSKYEFGGERYELAPVTLYVHILSAIAASEALLIAAWTKGVALQWAEDGGPTMVSVFEDVDPARLTRTGFTHATLVGKRHLAGFPRIEYAAQTVNCWTGVIDFPGSGEAVVPGDPDIPALTATRAFWEQAVTSACVGIKPAPGASYRPLDDMGATADATAVGGLKLTATSLSATWAALGSAPDVPTADNRGRHLAFLRAQNTGTIVGAVKYRAQSSVTGSSIAATTTVSQSQVDSTVANAGGWGVANLGEVQIPAGTVPDVETGSGYTSESIQVSQLTDSGTATYPSFLSGLWRMEFGQSFAGFTGLLTGVEYTVDTAPSVLAGWVVQISTLSSTVLATIALNAPMTVGTHRLPVSLAIVAGTTYVFMLSSPRLSSDATVGLAYGAANPYAGGSAVVASTKQLCDRSNFDLVFQVYGKLPLGFVSKTPVQAMTAESAKTATIDALIRVPLDAGAILWQPASVSTAGQGFYADYEPRIGSNVYLADVDGIGPSVIARCRRWGGLRAWPGVANRVVAPAYTPTGAVPGNVTVQMSVTGRSARLGSERPK